MKVRSTVALSRVKRKTSNERRYTNGYSPSPNRCKGSRCRGQQYPASSCKARKSAEVLLPTGTLIESTSALNTVWASSCPRDRHGRPSSYRWRICAKKCARFIAAPRTQHPAPLRTRGDRCREPVVAGGERLAVRGSVRARATVAAARDRRGHRGSLRCTEVRL